MFFNGGSCGIISNTDIMKRVADKVFDPSFTSVAEVMAPDQIFMSMTEYARKSLG